MARPKKQTVDYFPHDTDASEGRILTVIQNKYGNDGYAFWFKVKELLGRSPGHFYNFNEPDDWEFLLAKTHISDTETAQKILETMSILRAIDPELYKRGIIWSQDFVDSVEDVYKKRKEYKPERPNTVAEKPISASKIGVSGVNNPQSKVNKTKLLPLKGDGAKLRPTKDSRINEIFSEMRSFLGYPEDKVCGGEAVPAIEESSAMTADRRDPIPNYGKEGKAIKRMLTRGFTSEEILACWESKLSQRGGEFVSMVWVNEDIGKQKRRSTQPSTEVEIAKSIKEAGK